MDKDTNRILTDADNVQYMVESDGWKFVKQKLDAKLLDLQNINNLDMEDIGTLPIQLSARKMAVDIIWGWLKDDIYGFVEQQEANKEKKLAQIESFIERE